MTLEVLLKLAICWLAIAIFNGGQCLRAPKWYNYHLLINPGLKSQVTVDNQDACVAACQSTSGCSAVSYQQGSASCIMSMCAALQLVFNNGWNTYVLISVLVESVDYEAPLFDWMLTDTCGLTSTGSLAGVPSMVAASPSGTSYNSSQSIYQGNAMRLDGNLGTYAYTSPSSLFNVNYSTTGFTMSGWYNLEVTTYSSIVLFAFGYSSGSSYTQATRFLYLTPQLYYNLNENGPTSNKEVFAAYSLPVNTWLHMVLVYDPLIPAMLIYINGSLINLYNLGAPIQSHSVTPNQISVGATSSGANFKGKIYCVRFHSQALNSNELDDLSTSCLGRLKIS